MRVLTQSNKLGKGLSPVLSDQLWLLGILAAGIFAFAMVTVFVVSMFTDIRISAWSVVGSAAPWYMAGISGWIVYIQIPLFVTNGRSRKAGFREWFTTGITLVPSAAILMAIGFLLEKGIYNLAGFTTDLDETHRLGNATDFLILALQYLLTFAVWFALGGFVGASLYRSSDWGWVSIPIGIAIASLTGVWDHSGGGFFGFARRIVPGIDYESAWLDVGLSGIAIAIGVWLAWSLIQAMPMRNP